VQEFAAGANGSAPCSSILAHERLAIVDMTSGEQPLLTPDGSVALSINGEIYNHQQLKHELATPYAFSTQSDCEVRGSRGFLHLTHERWCSSFHAQMIVCSIDHDRHHEALTAVRFLLENIGILVDILVGWIFCGGGYFGGA